jgi:hypothetical protein
MYRILIFYIIVFSNSLSNFFSKMVKSKMVVLTRTEKTDMTNADVTVDWMM